MMMTSMEFSITWCDIIIPPLQTKKLRLTMFRDLFTRSLGSDPWCSLFTTCGEGT